MLYDNKILNFSKNRYIMLNHQNWHFDERCFKRLKNKYNTIKKNCDGLGILILSYKEILHKYKNV